MNAKLTLNILFFILNGLWFSSIAQQTITIDGENFYDAAIRHDARSTHTYVANTNYGTLNRITSTAWTASGYKTTGRTLMYFNLSAIPARSTIQSATLYFYSDPTITGSSLEIGNSQLSGSNAFYLEKVIQEWDEYTVTWNNQPTTTTTSRIWVGPSTSTTENKQTGFCAENWGLRH
jgi:hypothetical protein